MNTKQQLFTKIMERVNECEMQSVLAEHGSLDRKSLPASSKVLFYIDTLTPGVLDLNDLANTNQKEFFQMAYYSLIGELPEEAVADNWSRKQGLSVFEYRAKVMENLMDIPEVKAKERIIRHNIYWKQPESGQKVKKSLRQQILMLGYSISRNMPLSLKVPIKRLAMKILMK